MRCVRIKSVGSLESQSSALNANSNYFTLVLSKPPMFTQSLKYLLYSLMDDIAAVCHLNLSKLQFVICISNANDCDMQTLISSFVLLSVFLTHEIATATFKADL